MNKNCNCKSRFEGKCKESAESRLCCVFCCWSSCVLVLLDIEQALVELEVWAGLHEIGRARPHNQGVNQPTIKQHDYCSMLVWRSWKRLVIIWEHTLTGFSVGDSSYCRSNWKCKWGLVLLSSRVCEIRAQSLINRRACLWNASEDEANEHIRVNK
jgi:hypothetical protein